MDSRLRGNDATGDPLHGECYGYAGLLGTSNPGMRADLLDRHQGIEAGRKTASYSPSRSSGELRNNMISTSLALGQRDVHRETLDLYGIEGPDEIVCFALAGAFRRIIQSQLRRQHVQPVLGAPGRGLLEQGSTSNPELPRAKTPGPASLQPAGLSPVMPIASLVNGSSSTARPPRTARRTAPPSRRRRHRPARWWGRSGRRSSCRAGSPPRHWRRAPHRGTR